MYQQATIDFTNRVENTQESNAILNTNKEHINRSCMKVLELLKEGKRLTVLGAAVDYKITSLPRRILDLKQHGIPVKDRLVDGRFKEYFL